MQKTTQTLPLLSPEGRERGSVAGNHRHRKAHRQTDGQTEADRHNAGNGQREQ